MYEGKVGEKDGRKERSWEERDEGRKDGWIGKGSKQKGNEQDRKKGGR